MEKEYKKSYVGFWIWIIGYCMVCVGCFFLPEMDTQILLAIVDNMTTFSLVVLAYMIYRYETVYWYNGTEFEVARKAGSERRKAFALAHLKRFGWFAILFFFYSVISILIGIPYGIDIAVVTVGIIATAFSTIMIKL